MLQDDLSDAMLGMARSLKDRSVAFGEALREDSKVLDMEAILIIIVDRKYYSNVVKQCRSYEEDRR